MTSEYDILNRVKILNVGYDEVLNLLNPFNSSYAAKTINHEELLDGFKVISVHNNHDTRGFDMLISHPSFELIEPGTIPPRLRDLQRVQVLYKIEKV